MDPTGVVEHQGSPKFFFPQAVSRISTTTRATPTTTINFPVSQQHTAHAVHESELYQWVNSFYGPGAVGSWLLIVCSVIVSWTLNPHQRRKDHITNDLIAALMFPCIASAHLAHLLSELPAPLLEVLTSADLEMLQRIAAVAAPLNICEVFPTLALLLFTIAAWRRQIKRAVLTLAVGVLCWSMLNTFYIKGQAKNTERRQLNLQGDSLTDEQFAEVIMLIGWTLICMVLAPILLICCCAGMILVLIKGTAVLSGLATAVAFFIVIFMSRNLLEDSTRKVGGVVTVKSQPFFIPRTDTSIQSLDQVVALCGGCVTLLFSLIEAFQARRKSRAAENNQQANSVQAAGGCNGLGWEEEVSVQVLLHRRRSV